MKRYTLFIYVAALLTMLGTVLPLSAQQSQDALYIFRNDGGFNAFFYNDIDRFEYSKTDTLGVEHDKFVVQEVYALDSVFRIPLNAIDSIAFVTPPTKFKADVIMVDESIADYIVASDSATWFRLSTNTPQSLVPKKDEKIVIEGGIAYLPDGLAGYVSSVATAADGYTVTMREANIHDFYDRLVINFAAGRPSAGHANARSAGENEEYSVISEPIELVHGSGKYSFSASYDMLGSFKAINDYVDLSLDGNAGFSWDGTVTLRDMRITYYYDGKLEKASDYERYDVDLKTKLSLSGGLTGHFKFPLKGLKKKIEEELSGYHLDTDVSIGPFIEGSGSGTWELDTDHTLELHTVLTAGGGLPALYVEPALRTRKYDWSGATDKYSAAVGLNVGAEFKLGKYRGMEIKAGIGSNILKFNVECEDPVSEAAIKSIDLEDTPEFYDLLNKDDLLNCSITFVDFQKTLKIGNLSISKIFDNHVFFPFFPNIKDFEWKGNLRVMGWVPNIKGILYEPDEEKPFRGTISVPLEGRDLIYPNDVGFVVWDDSTKQVVDTCWIATFDDDFDGLSYHSGGTPLKVYEGLDPGKYYRINPLTLHHNWALMTKAEQKFTLGDAELKLKEHDIHFGMAGAFHREVGVFTNITDVRPSYKAPWLKVKYDKVFAKISIDCEELDYSMVGLNYREDDVIAIGYNREGKELRRDTIKVSQGEYGIAFIPSVLDFDKKGGTKTVKIESSVKNLKATFTRNENDHFSMKLVNDSTLTVTAPENKGKSLNAYITVTGTTPAGKEVKNSFNVYQESGYEEKPDTTTYLNTFTGGYIQLTTYFDNGKYTVLTAGEEKPDIGGLVSVDGDKLIYNYSKSSTFERDTSYNVKNDAGKNVYKEGKIQCNYTETIRLVLLPDSGNNVSQYVVESGHVTYDRIDIYENKNVYMRNWLYDLNDLKVDVCSGYIEFSTGGNWFDNENDTDHITNFSWASTSEGQLSLSKAAYLRLDLYTPKDYPLLSVHENYLEFDNMGQLLDYNAKFIHSNLSDLKVTSSDEWIKVKILDAEEEDISQHYEDALSFDLDYNDAETERSGFICVQGTTNDGQIIKRYIRIKQQANDVHGEGGESATLPTDDILNELKNYMPIYTGSTPPNLDDKTIDMSPLTVCYDSDGETSVGASGIVFSFGHWLSQGNATLDVKHYPYVGGNRFAVSEHTYQIQGSGQNFTLGYVLSWEIEGSEYIPEQKHSMSTVISGTLTSKGFENLYMATISSEQVNNQEPERSITILKDTDGLSIPTIWNPGDALFDEDDDED